MEEYVMPEQNEKKKKKGGLLKVFLLVVVVIGLFVGLASVVVTQENQYTLIRQFGKIEKDEINLEEKTSYIENYVAENKRISFRDLLEKQNSKMEVIVTFLVILELMKVGVIQIEQNEIFDDIIITYMGKQAQSVVGLIS